MVGAGFGWFRSTPAHRVHLTQSAGTARDRGTNCFRQRLLVFAPSSHKRWSSPDETIVTGLGLLAACVATRASAETVNLTGTYRCIQMCRNGMLGALTFVTQNGEAVNLTTKTGGLARLERALQPNLDQLRAARAPSIRQMACAFSSMMVEFGAASGRRPWCCASRQWSAAGSFQRWAAHRAIPSINLS